MTIAISANIGGNTTKVSIFDSSGQIDSVIYNTPLTGDQTRIPHFIRDIIFQLLQKNMIVCEKEIHVGISIAGYKLVNKDENKYFASNICQKTNDDGSLINNWEFIDFKHPCMNIFSSVSVANDVIAETITESRWGTIQGISNAIFVNWGTGIGIGIVSNGTVLTGKNNNASHGGHQIINEKDKSVQCGCGQYGDIESIAGGRFLEIRWGNSISSLFEAYNEGNSTAKRIIEDATHALMIGVTNLGIALDSEVFCLGGGLLLNHSEVLIPILESKLRLVPTIFRDGFNLKKSSLGGNTARISGLAVIPSGKISWLDEQSFYPANC